MTLKRGLAGANSLNLVRLVLASLVIVSHTWPIGAFGKQWGGEPPLGHWAVGGFFCLSGFLIAGSRMRLGVVRYLWNRSLRILPGFWVCLAVTAFVLAPLSAMIEGAAWSPASAIQYVGRNAALYVHQSGIDDTLLTAPYAPAWNGSLWTLFFEFGAYLACGVLLTGVLRHHPLFLSSVLFAGATAITPWADQNVRTDLYTNALHLGTFFLAGMVIFFASNRLPVSLVGATACLIGFGVLAALGVEMWLGPLPLAYMLLVVGATVPACWVQTHDISYGLYIYAFPMQQLLAVLGVQRLGLPAFMAASFVTTVPLAWLSWMLVERPAMTLKRTKKASPLREKRPGDLPSGQKSVQSETGTWV